MSPDSDSNDNNNNNEAHFLFVSFVFSSPVSLTCSTLNVTVFLNCSLLVPSVLPNKKKNYVQSKQTLALSAFPERTPKSVVGAQAETLAAIRN